MYEIYRPTWTCGRFHQSNSSYALFYNLIEGMAYFFEEESADIINEILKVPKGSIVSLSKLKKITNNQFTTEEIKNFCTELISAGLLTEGIISEKRISEYRRLIGHKRKKIAYEVKKTVKERLPFKRNDAENTFMTIIEKANIPFSAMFEVTYGCTENCVHCFNPGAARNDNEESERNNRNEINIKHYEKLLDELQTLGVVKIILTGGDPFVKKDIWKLIEMI